MTDLDTICEEQRNKPYREDMSNFTKKLLSSREYFRTITSANFI